MPTPALHNVWRNAWVANRANNSAIRPYLVGGSLLNIVSFPTPLYHITLSYIETLGHTPRFPSSYRLIRFLLLGQRFVYILQRWLPWARYTPHAYLLLMLL